MKPQNKHLPMPLSITVFCVILYAYAVILFFTFGYHNDYRLWEYSTADGILGFLETRHLIGIGRPLLAVLLNVHLYFIHDMASLQVAQLCSILFIAATAAAYFYFVQRTLRISLFGAAVLAVLTFILPAMAINAFWVTNMVSGILALWLPFAAFIFLQHTKPSWLRLTTAGLLLYVTCLIYPPSAFFFVSLIAITLLFGPKDPNTMSFQNLMKAIGLILAVAAVYFVSIKIIMKPYLISHPDIFYATLKGYNWKEYYEIIDAQFPQYALHLGLNLKTKGHQLKEYTIMILSGWFPLFRIRWVILIGFAIIPVLFYAARQSNYPLKQRPVLLTSLIIAVWGLTALPTLVSPGVYEITYRLAFASMALLPAIFIYAAEQALSYFKASTQRSHQWGYTASFALIAFVVLFAALSASKRLTLVVHRSSHEYQWILNSLNQQLTPQTKHIHIRLPLIEPANQYYLAKDFGLNASDIGIQGILYAALQSLNKNVSDYTFSFGQEAKSKETKSITVEDPITHSPPQPKTRSLSSTSSQQTR